MSFAEILLLISDSVDSFFLKYNYNNFFWFVYDNYLPSRTARAFDKLSFLFLSVNEKLYFLSFFSLSSISYIFITVETLVLNSFTPYVTNAILMSLKFLICISILIFARGGIPRFRFDYLTKLGWIRFLSLVLLFFLIEIILLAIA
jgi:hypothetical protein